MSVFRLGLFDESVTAEKKRLETLGLAPAVVRARKRWIDECVRRARRLPGGFVRVEVCDAAGGYPEHLWGFTQYSPRPYIQGYGCDGTTDRNVHLIAAVLCNYVGVDYVGAMSWSITSARRAGVPDAVRMVVTDVGLRAETLLPQAPTVESLMLCLSDLYQINCKPLVGELERRFSRAGFVVAPWWLRERSLRIAMRRIHEVPWRSRSGAGHAPATAACGS
jgi:hypothetical protein